MEITFEKITSPTDIPLEIKELYHSAFPECERREWSELCLRVNPADPVFNFHVIKHNSEIAGFITLWNLPGAIYCEHFAILNSMRGKGLGSDVIKKTLEFAGDKALVLEVELPEESDIAASRVKFYQRCGMIAMEDFPYWQPPYRAGQPEFPLMLMTSRPLADPTGFVMILHTVVYNQ